MDFTRRSLLAMAAGVLLDPERLLWVPGRKVITFPNAETIYGGVASFYRLGDVICSSFYRSLGAIDSAAPRELGGEEVKNLEVVSLGPIPPGIRSHNLDSFGENCQLAILAVTSKPANTHGHTYSTFKHYKAAYEIYSPAKNKYRSLAVGRKA